MQLHLEMYDKHGLMLHSGHYRPQSVEVGGPDDIYEEVAEFLTNKGASYPRCKTLVVRYQKPNNLFMSTVEYRNPSHNPEVPGQSQA